MWYASESPVVPLYPPIKSWYLSEPAKTTFPSKSSRSTLTYLANSQLSSQLSRSILSCYQRLQCNGSCHFQAKIHRLDSQTQTCIPSIHDRNWLSHPHVTEKRSNCLHQWSCHSWLWLAYFHRDWCSKHQCNYSHFEELASWKQLFGSTIQKMLASKEKMIAKTLVGDRHEFGGMRDNRDF